MVDITGRLILYRLNEVFTNMVERLDRFVYTDETKETVDVVNMLLFGWIVLALLVYIFGNLIANHLQKRRDNAIKDDDTKTESKEHAESNGKTITGKIDSSVPVEPDVIKATHVNIANQAATAAPTIRVKTPVKDKPISAFRTEKREISLPEATGTDPDCVKWVNNVVHWLYNQEKHNVNPHVDSWLNSLNEEAQKASAEHGILVEFKRLQDGSLPPQLDDIRTDFESNDNLTTVCNVEADHMTFDVRASRHTGDTTDVTEYEIELEKLTGKLNIACITEELLLVVRFAKQPTTKLKLKQISSSEEAASPQERALKDVVLEIVNQAIASAVVDLSFATNTDFPHFKRKSSSAETLMPIHYDSLISTSAPPAHHERRLLVKVIKATNIGGDKGCKEAYCLVEMDEPPQKFQTMPMKDSGSPFWDEHFWFDLQDSPAELLFEIYDKGEEKDNFLGLGIVSIEELLKSPSQRQIIPLQSRPLENDDVSGSLTVEFLFMEGGIVPTKEALVNATTLEPLPSGKIIETNHRVTPAGAVITTTTIQRVPTETAVAPKTKIAPASTARPSACSSAANSECQLVSDATGTPSLPLSWFTSSSNEQISVEHSSHSALSPILSAINQAPALNAAAKMNLRKSRILQENPDCASNDKVADKSTVDLDASRKDNISNPLPERDTSEHEASFVSSASPLVVPGSVSETTAPSCSPVVEASAMSISHSSSHVKVSTKPNQEVPGFPLTMQQKHDTSNDQAAGAVARVNGIGAEEEESIADTALKELGKSGISSSASKSTLIIHSVQREAVRPPVKENGVEGDSTSTTPPSSPASRPEHLSPADSMSSSTDEQDRARSRSKERKSLMGALKKRFSFSKSRSKSAEQRSTKEDAQSNAGSRSQSMERAKSMPASRESSAPRTPGSNLLHVPGSGSRVDSNSTRSSMSELSGCSSSSTRTFVHEKSTLVIEINENDVIKHYIIPASLAHKSKWRKRGVKLHIYNGHTFVAKHLSGSITCQVCKKLFPRRPGKQGYACRDCNFMSHKRCHIEVETHCPKSTINSMEMEYIQDPKAKAPAS